MAYAEPATDSTPSVSSAIYFGGSNSNSTSKMSTNTISSHGIDTPVGVSNSYNNRLPNGYSLFGPSSIQQENMASSSTSAVSALGGDELPDWIKGIKKSNGSDTSSNSVNSDLRTSFISKLNVSSSQLSPIEDERKSIETTTKCLSLPEQTDLLLKEKAQLREKLDIAKSQPGYLSSSLLQTAEYLKFKQTKAEIMRNFSNNRIFFISKNNERIPHSHYQTICDRAKAQNVSPEMLLQGINLQFITNVDQKKKETIIKDVFIPLYGIGK